MKGLTRGKVIGGCAIVAVLALSFFWGGHGFQFPGQNPREGDSANPVVTTEGALLTGDLENSTGGALDTDNQTNPEDSVKQEDGASQEGGVSPNGASQEEPSPNGASPNGTNPEGVENGKNSGKPKGDGLESRPGGSDGGLSVQEKLDLAASMGGGSSAPKGSESYSESQGMEINPETGKDQYQTDPVPEGKPTPVEPQHAVITDKKMTCTLSVSCASILEHMDWLDPEKVELVPEDGVIFASRKVTFYEGENVFQLLKREMKDSKIHMEFEDTPVFNSAYIEGINNLYEFDCGELSGWMYKVNGWFPNYGCSRYQLKEGDVVEWVYTCDLGRDVGGYYSLGGE